jgi:hypothetical protein
MQFDALPLEACLEPESQWVGVLYFAALVSTNLFFVYWWRH